MARDWEELEKYQQKALRQVRAQIRIATLVFELEVQVRLLGIWRVSRTYLDDGDTEDMKAHQRKREAECEHNVATLEAKLASIRKREKEDK